MIASAMMKPEQAEKQLLNTPAEKQLGNQPSKKNWETHAKKQLGNQPVQKQQRNQPAKKQLGTPTAKKTSEKPTSRETTRKPTSPETTEGLSLLVFNVTCNTISVIHVTAQMCKTLTRKKLEESELSSIPPILVGFGCNGASTMGKTSRLVALLKIEHPKIIGVQCLAHRRELTFKDVFKRQTVLKAYKIALLFLQNSTKQRNKSVTFLRFPTLPLSISVPSFLCFYYFSSLFFSLF